MDIVTQKLGKRINNLIIDSLSAKHAGNYTCVAENIAGMAQHSSELVVISTNENIFVFNSTYFVVVILFPVP